MTDASPLPPPRKALRLLIVEDQEADAALLLLELGRLGYDVTWERVETKKAMTAALTERPWDIIVSDFSMPLFSAQAALGVCQELAVELPFIIYSGTVEEENAIEAMRLGADDFISKTRLARLGSAITRSLREVEERRAHRAAEARLRQAQKMEAIGQLAGGVAHDFNNLVSVIQGCGELLSKEIAAEDPRKKRVDDMLRAATRAASLTRQLLAFSRQHPLESKPIDLNAVIVGIEAMFRRLISADIQIVTVLANDLHPIKADPTQIEQVLMNLVINARDAMGGGGGRLAIETKNVDLDAAYVRSHPDAHVGPHALLAVSDSGAGMDPDTLARVFEPFFTTKALGRGTGLGLATVYGVVTQSGGHIAVESEPGQGTTFNAYFPRTEEAVAGAVVRPAGPRVAKGSETVLVIEDEPDLRAIIGELLRDAGYTVLEGPDPEVALRAAGQHVGPIHLIITDLVMPKVSGQKAAARLQASRPGVKVLYMSGYSSTAGGDVGELPPNQAFLQKPFSLDTLLRKVREVLDVT